MRSSRLIWAVMLVWAGFLLPLFVPAVAVAQSDSSPDQAIIVPPVSVQDHGATLGVRVPFRLADQEGDPINNASNLGLQVRLLDMPEGAIDVFPASSAERIETPYFVALLIDTSGSMKPYIGDVRSAAQNAVRNAPQNVRFRIVSFRGRDANDRPIIDVLQNFTEDRGSALNAISSISNPDGATCYYDAVYESLSALNSQSGASAPSARRAVVAFTDGEDIIAANDPRPCSRRTIDDVIQEARRTKIPVYTIGMYGTNPANIRQDDLRRLASDTGGLAAIGGASEIVDLFQQVFAGLINQYSAVFETLAKKGRNEAILEVNMNGAGEPARAVFTFESPKDYVVPTPTVMPPPPPPTAVPTAQPYTEVILDQPRPDPNNSKIYNFRVSLSNPSIVEELYLEVLAGNVSVLVQRAPIHGANKPEIIFSVDTSSLKPGQEYVAQIQGVDIYGNRLVQPPRGLDDGPNPILAESKPFTIEGEKPVPLEVKIVKLQADLAKKELTFELAINQPETVDKYRPIINNEAGETVVDPGVQVFPFDKNAIAVPMPPAAANPVDVPQPLKFRLALTVVPLTGSYAEAQYDFELTPPKAAGTFDQIIAGLEQNPLLAIGIVVVLSSLVLFLVFGRSTKKKAFNLARPVEEYTIAAGAAVGSGKTHGKLLVEVLETPSPGDQSKRTFNRFPCVIGRSHDCDVRLPGDGQLSRKHASLTINNGRIILTDLTSNNGTFVEGERLAPGTPKPLSDAQIFQLGRHTKIRVSLQY